MVDCRNYHSWPSPSTLVVTRLRSYHRESGITADASANAPSRTVCRSMYDIVMIYLSSMIAQFVQKNLLTQKGEPYEGLRTPRLNEPTLSSKIVLKTNHFGNKKLNEVFDQTRYVKQPTLTSAGRKHQ